VEPVGNPPFLVQGTWDDTQSRSTAPLSGAAAGDDHDFLRTFEAVDPIDRFAVARVTVFTLARGRGAAARARAIGRTLSTPALAEAQCAQASTLAADLGMTARVARALEQIFERFDGTGAPRGLEGKGIARSSRILQAATLAEIAFRQGGERRARSMSSRRQLEPRIVEAFLAEAAGFWPFVCSTSAWEAFLAAEPAPSRTIAGVDRRDIALAFARYADLKVPSKLGHRGRRRARGGPSSWPDTRSAPLHRVRAPPDRRCRSGFPPTMKRTTCDGLSASSRMSANAREPRYLFGSSDVSTSMLIPPAPMPV